MRGSFLKFQKSHTQKILELRLHLEYRWREKNHSAPCRQSHTSERPAQHLEGHNLPTAEGSPWCHRLSFAPGTTPHKQEQDNPPNEHFSGSPFLTAPAAYSCDQGRPWGPATGPAELGPKGPPHTLHLPHLPGQVCCPRRPLRTRQNTCLCFSSLIFMVVACVGFPKFGISKTKSWNKTFMFTRMGDVLSVFGKRI